MRSNVRAKKFYPQKPPDIPLTKETLTEAKVKIEELSVYRAEVLVRLQTAREMGDLSENAEYHSAREDMAWAQSRAKEVEYILDHGEIISNKSGKSDYVTIGSSILVSFMGTEKKFDIVGPQEADPANSKISNESPLGAAFLEKKVGDKVEIEVPAGTQSYEILEIS